MKLNARIHGSRIGNDRVRLDSAPCRAEPAKANSAPCNNRRGGLDKESRWYASVLGFEKSNPFDSPDSKGCCMVIPGYRVVLID
jgi:hypothetical protein